MSLFHKGLEEHGVQFDRSNSDYLQWRWLLKNRRRVDVLHLHWIQYHYTHNDKRASICALARFAGKLLLARALRYRIVWTMHQVLPHEPSSPPVYDRLARNIVSRLAAAVIVHCDYAKEALVKHFARERNVFVVPHPNYCEVVQSFEGRKEARAKLRLQQFEFVFLFFGLVRPYKGVEDLIGAFHRLSDADQALVIAGKPWDEGLAANITSHVATDARIFSDLEYVSDQKLMLYLRAASAVVLPFRDMLTSGSAMMALSVGRPVIAPAVGCLPELLTPKCGILYDPGDPDGLRDALIRCRHVDLDAMGRQANLRAQQFTTEKVATETIKAYRA